MTVNNFEQVKPLLEFTNKGDFYWIQIIKRRKENPNLNKCEKIIDFYNIYSLNMLDECKHSIIEKCLLHNARAYIHVNKRNDEVIALKTLSLIAENIATKNYDIRNCYHSCCGKYKAIDNKKRWILDVDTFELEKYEWISICLEVFDIIPTINGRHFIVAPFNTEEFKELEGLDIHKDNGTLIFYSDGN